MATLTFELEQFSKGYFLAWIVTTQCWNSVEVTLKAGNTEYFHSTKTNRNTGLQVLTQNSRDHNSGETPILTITVPESAQLKQSTTSGAVNDLRARKVGYVYDFCIEDQNDEDFNDVYINIVGWAKKG